MTIDLERLHMKDDINEAEINSITPQQLGMHLFELYLALQEFCKLREQLSPQ